MASSMARGLPTRSTANLTRAIHGWQAEHGSAPEHESTNSLLERVKEEMHRGSVAPMSPGRESTQEMMAERGHSGGDGQRTANAPGHANRGEPAADLSEHDPEAAHNMSGAGPPRSAGNTRSALPGGYAGGASQLRRIAADRERSREDSKFTPLTHAGENNKESNPRGEGYPPASRVGNARISGPPSPQGEAASSARDATQPEAEPVRVPQQRNSFARAGEEARSRFKRQR